MRGRSARLALAALGLLPAIGSVVGIVAAAAAAAEAPSPAPSPTMASPVAAPPVIAAADLAQDLAAAMAAGDWARAEAAARRLVERAPEDPGPAYNLACVLARKGETGPAIAALRRSAELGFRFTATMLRDADLDPVRAAAGYAAALDLVRANNARALEQFKRTAAEQAEVLEFVPPRVRRGEPLPLLVALHGSGGDAASFARAWQAVAARAGVLLVVPQGMTRQGKGYSWGVAEEGEHLILRAIARARERHDIDPARIVLTGFSQGGGMAFLVALRHPELITGVVPVAGFYDHRVAPVPAPAATSGLEPAPATVAAPVAAAPAPVSLPRFYILNGERDEEAENNREAARRLQAAGAAVKIRIVPGVGHAFPPEGEPAIAAALDFVLDR